MIGARSRSAAIAMLAVASALAALCVGISPVQADPPAKPDPSVTTTSPTAPTTSQSAELRQIIAPAVRLSNDHGAPGTTFSATATGSAPCRLPAIALQWDSTPPVSPAVDYDKGTATVNFTVPEVAEAGPHKVSATCNGKAYASSPFTVVEKPSLTIDPHEGPPGATVKATGTGFACGDDTDTVELTLDKEVLGTGSAGRFSEQVTVPLSATIGGHPVVASCHKHPDVNDQQTFTVTTPVTNTTKTTSVTSTTETTSVTTTTETTSVTTTENTTTQTTSAPPTTETTPVAPTTHTTGLAWYWWVLLLIAVAVAMVGTVSHMTKPLRPPKPPVVHAISRVASPPRVMLQETPARGESTHALRLETHSGERTLTVEEVNDDHTHTE